MFSPIYAGSYVTDASFGSFTPVGSAKHGEIVLTRPMPGPPERSSDIWLCDVGPGDHAGFEPVFVGELD